MTNILGCHIPENLYYSVEHNVWLQVESNECVVIGMTAYACSLAGEVVSVMPKKAGRAIKKDRSCATIESGKWVGPVKTPMDCEILESNALLVSDPSIINDDPYGEGWIARLHIENWLQQSVDLLTGEQAVIAFKEKMNQDGFGGC